MHPMLQRRYLHGVGWVGTGLTPTYARSSGPAPVPASAGTMRTVRTTLPASEPASFMSFPPGAGSSPPTAPSGGGLPSGALRTPAPSSSPFDPGGGVDPGAGAEPPPDTTATIYDATNTSLPQMAAEAQGQLDALSRSWKVSGIFALTAIAAWFLGKRTLSYVAIGGAAFVGYRAWRS